VLREIDFLLKICDRFLASFTCEVKLVEFRTCHSLFPTNGASNSATILEVLV